MMNSSLKRLLASMALAAATLPVSASDLLGFYVGAGATRSDVTANLTPGVTVADRDTGWKGLVGIRALSMFGAELEYVDLGSASAGSASAAFSANADLKATALYGLFWLPIPAPIVDVYVKGGVARFSGDFNFRNNSTVACPAPSPAGSFCSPTVSRSLRDDVGAAGAGAQVKLGSWALRGDYERFFASGSDPHVISLSVVKFFL